MFFVDNVDVSNNQCLIVEGASNYELHITAIQCVFAKKNASNHVPVVRDVVGEGIDQFDVDLGGVCHSSCT